MMILPNRRFSESLVTDEEKSVDLMKKKGNGTKDKNRLIN
jgi:hypothetical protein